MLAFSRACEHLDDRHFPAEAKRTTAEPMCEQ